VISLNYQFIKETEISKLQLFQDREVVYRVPNSRSLDFKTLRKQDRDRLWFIMLLPIVGFL